MQTIYIEKAAKQHPRAETILKRFASHATVIECEHYREVFNPKYQNFRQQKENKPALILAVKTGRCVLPAPEGFGIGSHQNYYFSHMLNCLYDCRYCFLQGLYPSAHYVLFVNYEDFMCEIEKQITTSDTTPYFFTGYDADSLAFEPVSAFLETFLPFFKKNNNAYFELRTKSANIAALLNHTPLENVICAFSFTPEIISRAVEHKVPPLKKRIAALHQLAQAGWPVGLRFDPIIFTNNYQMHYAELIDSLFSNLLTDVVHSVSLGPMRFPAKMYQKLSQLYPNDALLAHPLEKRAGQFTYRAALETEMKDFVKQCLQPYLPEKRLFECHLL